MKTRFLARVSFIEIDHIVNLIHALILGSATMPSFEASLGITLAASVGKHCRFPPNPAIKLQNSL